MATPRITELEHWDAVAPRFRGLADLPWPAWLDSASRRVGARYDILVADPYVTLRTRGAVTEISRRGGETVESARAPLELVREALGSTCAPAPGLPFFGGAVGYVSYDLGRRFERIPSLAAADIAMPELAIGIYDWAVIVDHVDRKTWLAGLGRDSRTFARWLELVERLHAKQTKAAPAFRVLSPPTPGVSRAEYAAAFARVQDHIRRGDCYQVNLTQRFVARAEGDAWRAYLRLREINPAPFAAFLDFPDGRVLSSSPERFLRVDGDRVETKPIKGTRPRAADAARDRAQAEALRSSAKDRAENVMIVDLLRNDLGKSCVPGSVRVTKLFDVESYASVHQLVSTIEGRLAPGKHALDVLAGCFPGGSITGAPKVAAMKIIEELEPQRRSVYCGCIGYVGYDGNMDTNIAIRTLVQHGEHVYTWAGGGVVADSEVDAEYQESLDKAAALLAVLDERAFTAAS
ncbi:MAG TPA: aminodeoxychorismate synthase component I [Gammaproteobacteria bacterium]|nr:aminodeoxychorismate synthase component I [Gammaproteobacteria bacterium]